MKKELTQIVKSEVDVNTLNLLPVAIILFDNRKIYFLNTKAIELLQISRQQLKNLNKYSIFQFLDKKYHAQITKNNKLILKGEEFKDVELEFRNFKNNIIFVEAQANVVHYKGIRVIQTAFSEISERRERLLVSESSKDLLQKIGENSLDVIFNLSFHPKVQVKFISDSAKTVLGFYPEEIYKNPLILKNNIHKDDQKFIFLTAKDYLKVSKNGIQKSTHVRFTTKKGKEKFLEVVVNPVLDSKKKVIGLIGNMRDDTERMETEALLIETKEKFDLITRNGNDIIAFFTFLPTEKYLYVSPNIKKILGYNAEQLLSDSNFFNKRVVGDRKDALVMEKKLLVNQKKNVVKNFYYVFKTLKSNGQEIRLENKFSPILDSQGKIRFYLYVLRDVTQQNIREIEVQNQYINYKNLLDISPVAYMIHKNGICLYANNSLLNILKIKNKNQIIGKSALDFVQKPYEKYALRRLKDVSANKNLKDFSYFTITDNNGKSVDIEIKSVNIKYNNEDCILALINNLSEQKQREKEKRKTERTQTDNKLLQKEIKERQAIEKSLIEKSAHLTSIFESSTHLIWTVNRNYNVTSYNQNFKNIVKLQHGIDIDQGYKIDEHLKSNIKDYVNFWYPKYNEAFSGKKLEFEKEDYNNRKVVRQIFINPIYNTENEITEISCIANDVTDSKIYEQKLINQTAKLTAIFDSSHHYIWTIDANYKLTSFNKNYFDLVSSLYNTLPYVGLVLNRGVLSNDKGYNELLEEQYKRAFAGRAVNFEIETLDKNYKKIYLEIFLNPIYESDTVAEVSGIAHNITDSKHNQQRMEISLKEKEVLLREVHHRVKNNMQVVSSILNLQSSYVSDEYALALLKESQNRIKTMAYIHESLYQNKSFTSVNFSDYVHTLVNNIVQSYSYSTEKIKLDLSIEKITLSLDNSIPVGLIINELVTNAIKHAFPNQQTGTISINLKSENNVVFLDLKDDGAGFSAGVDFENSHSLGLQLVNTLIEQIEGNVKFKSKENEGTEILISFKI